MAVNEYFKCWFGTEVTTAQCGPMKETFDISNSDCIIANAATYGGDGSLAIPFMADSDDAGTASEWFAAGYCNFHAWWNATNGTNTLGCPSGYSDDSARWLEVYGYECTHSLCCAPDQTVEELYGPADVPEESIYGEPQYAVSYGGQLVQGLITPSFQVAEFDEDGPVLTRVLMENYEASHGGGGQTFFVNDGSTAYSWGIFDQTTYLYGLTQHPGGGVIYELREPFEITDWSFPPETLTYSSHRGYLSVELNYLANTIGYDVSLAALDLEGTLTVYVEELIDLVGTSEIANQVLNNVVDYGKIRASQVTAISQKEATQTINILPGNTSTY